MEVYKTREFARLTRKADVPDSSLREAVSRAENGLIDGDYGSELIKQRIARASEGRSGGFRAVLFHRRGERAIFLHLFAKKDRSDLTTDEKRAFREAAKLFGKLQPDAIKALVAQGKWLEINDDQCQTRIQERSAPLPPSGDGGPARGRRRR